MCLLRHSRPWPLSASLGFFFFLCVGGCFFSWSSHRFSFLSDDDDDDVGRRTAGFVFTRRFVVLQWCRVAVNEKFSSDIFFSLSLYSRLVATTLSSWTFRVTRRIGKEKKENARQTCNNIFIVLSPRHSSVDDRVASVGYYGGDIPKTCRVASDDSR